MVVAAGHHGHREIPWFMEVTRKTYGPLGDPRVEERFMVLDTPLATALMKNLAGTAPA